jgi:hypothetical protein
MNARTLGFILSAVSAIVPFILAGCMEKQLASSWPPEPIVVDGKANEWRGREVFYDEQEGLKIGVFNDAHFLYLYLSTWHQGIERQILMNGLTVWFDPRGGTKQVFGINYPMKREMPDRGESPDRGEMRDRGGAAGRQGEARPEEESSRMISRLLGAAQESFQIVDPSGASFGSMPANDSTGTGIQAAIDISNRTLFLELKVPLAKTDSLPFAVGAVAGKTIGVGFKVGTREMRGARRPGGERPEGSEGRPEGVGRPGGGMGGFPGGGNRGFMANGAAAAVLDMWIKVKLATAPASSPKG